MVQNSVNEKSVKSELNFAYSFRPIYYFSRVFGLMPFSVKYDSNGQPQMPRVGILDSLWFVTTICVYLSMAYISYQQMTLPQDPNAPKVLVFSEYLLQILGLVYGALIIGMDLCNRFKLVDVLKQLTTFDKEASECDFVEQLKIFTMKYIPKYAFIRWHAQTLSSNTIVNVDVLGSIVQQ